jgi:predicted AAA+ superfamily ATPase
VAAIFRLDTSFGGGKTHGLIALAHAARGMKGVPDPAEFIDPALIPRGDVRVAAFGENADPANGRRMDGGILAYTPWGEIACALAGREGYERVRRSDEQGVAPGAETIANSSVTSRPSSCSTSFPSICGKSRAGRTPEIS